MLEPCEVITSKHRDQTTLAVDGVWTASASSAVAGIAARCFLTVSIVRRRLYALRSPAISLDVETEVGYELKSSRETVIPFEMDSIFSRSCRLAITPELNQGVHRLIGCRHSYHANSWINQPTSASTTIKTNRDSPKS